MQVGMAGIDVSEETALLEQIQLARQGDYKEGGSEALAGDPRLLSERDTIMLFASQAKRLGVDINDTLVISTESITGRINTSDVRIVAIAKNLGFMSNWSVFVPKQVTRQLYQLNDDTSGAVMIYLQDPSRAEEVMGKLRESLVTSGFQVMEHQGDPFWRKFSVVSGEDWIGQKLDVTIWEDEISYLTWVVSALETVSFFLVAILLLIIVVGIMNTMWIAVRERTQEIGTLRAIGMHRRQVLAMFLVEAMLLGLFGSTVGTLMGSAIAIGFDAIQWKIPAEAVQAILMSDVLHLSVQPGQIIGIIVGFTVVTMNAAWGPAVRAARLRPITAIHRVG